MECIWIWDDYEEARQFECQTIAKTYFEGVVVDDVVHELIWEMEGVGGGGGW